MSIETMTKLATVTVGSGGSSTVSFTNIPQTYTDLKLLISGRTSRSAVYGEMHMRFNGSSTNYSARVLEGTGSTVGTYTETSIRVELNGNTATASTFGNAEFYIPKYTSSNYKSVSLDSVTENNATSVDSFFKAHLWSDTAAITQIDIGYGTGTISEFSTFTLYGIRNARRTVGNSIKATGGNISFDGTYVTHTFISSGTFTPAVSLLADYLVVAGGGGGGNADGTTFNGGGGGAGGLRCTVGTTGGGGTPESKVLLTAANQYAITIGAGGGSNSIGSNSSIYGTGVNVASSGGGRGKGSNFDGDGGSGGGGRNLYSAGGAGTTNQGYAGGSASGENAGGGGGAGAAGGNGSGSGAGNGGAGVAIAISGSSVTYAGGGGGGAATPGSGGAGGGGAGGNPTGTAGTANTGGGGGGVRDNVGATPRNGASGGSGIVIIRYKA